MHARRDLAAGPHRRRTRPPRRTEADPAFTLFSPAFQLAAHFSERGLAAGVGRLQRTTEDLRDVSHREAFDLVEDDDLALLFVERVEHAGQDPAVLTALEVRVLIGLDARIGRLRDDVLAPAPMLPSAAHGDADADRVDPRRH